MPSSSDMGYNHLEIKNFELQIDKLFGVTYNCISAPLPGLSSVAAPQYTPFATVKHPGDHIIYSPLIVTFIVDEEMKNWDEIFNWMRAYGHPDNTGEYRVDGLTPRQTVTNKKSGGSLLISNNKYNYSRSFIFEDLFPVDISEVMFDTQIDDVFVATCTASFEFTQFYPKIK